MDTDFLKNTFSKVIKDYDSARPGYPQALYDKVLSFSEIGKDADVLEVGAGTGQATDLFLQGEFAFDLLEVSEEQVLFLKQKYRDNPKVTVKKDYFEQYETEKKYDLIYSATAFHWVDSWIGYPKAWEMLKPGGTLAVFWHMSSVTFYSGGIFDGLNALKKKYLPQESLGFDAEGILKVKERRIAQIQSEGCFGVPEVFEYRWIDTYDADRYVTLLNTYSGSQTLSEEKRTAYLDEVREYINENGGKVELPQHVMLYMVQKNNIRFREAVLADCCDLAVLKGKVWNTTYQGIYPQEKLMGYDVEKNTRIFESIVANPEITLYVATDGEKIVGFMTCGKPYKPFREYGQEIGLLYILKEYQRQGIGRKFFRIARKLVAERGYKAFFLSVNKRNYDAQKFYLAMGGKVLCEEGEQVRIGYCIE